jgi:hypothetical protein
LGGVTTSVWDELAAEAEPLIVNGRYVIDGKKYTRATNFISAVDDNYGLVRWKLRNVAHGLAQSGAMRAEVLGNLTNPKVLDDICERAIQSVGSNEKRDLGSAIHTLTELADDGTIPSLEEGDPLAHAVNEWRRLLEHHHLTVVASEQLVVIERYGVAGRFDRILSDADGNLFVADIKTGKVKNGSFARQFALYAHADFIWDPIAKERLPMPAVNQDEALAVMLRTDGEGEILVVDIAKGWEDVELCAQVIKRCQRVRNDLVWPLGAIDIAKAAAKSPTKITPDAVSDTDAEVMCAALSQRIDAIKANARGLALLKAHWPSSVVSKPWPSGQLGAIDKAVSEVEGLLAKPEDWWALQDRFKALDPAARSIGRQWSREAADAGTPLHTGDNAAHRRIVNVMCMLLEATDDAEVCRDVIGLAMADDIQPAVALGAAWAALTDAELDAVGRFATAYRLGEFNDATPFEDRFAVCVAAMFVDDAA